MLMMQRQNFILILTAPDSTLVAGGGERTAWYKETLGKPYTQRSEDQVPTQTRLS